MKKYCIDCGKETKGYGERCRRCAAKKSCSDRGLPRKYFCLECGVEITYRAKRCRNCASKNMWKNPTEKMLNAQRTQLENLHTLPATDKQREVARNLGQLPRTEKQIEAAQKSIVKTFIKWRTEHPEEYRKSCQKGGRNAADTNAKNLNFVSSWEDKFYDEYLFPIFRDCELRRQFYLKGLKHPFDFAVVECKILIEVDGDYTHSRPGRKERDAEINEFVWRTYPDWQLFRYYDEDMKKLGIIK